MNAPPQRTISRRPPVVPARRSARASPRFPFLRILEDSVAHAAGESPPLRFVTMYHPHGIAAEAWAMRGADTESNFDPDVHRADVGGGLSARAARPAQVQAARHRGDRSAFERVRARLGGDDPDRQPHQLVAPARRQLVARPVPGGRAGARQEHAHHQHRAGGGDRQRRPRRDAVLRRGRRAAAEDHRPGAGVRSPVRRPRAQ